MAGEAPENAMQKPRSEPLKMAQIERDFFDLTVSGPVMNLYQRVNDRADTGHASSAAAKAIPLHDPGGPAGNNRKQQAVGDPHQLSQ
jgi:hypothetical protein